ncbi:hypothetical protein EON65_33145, partial [archaeon]
MGKHPSRPTSDIMRLFLELLALGVLFFCATSKPSVKRNSRLKEKIKKEILEKKLAALEKRMKDEEEKANKAKEKLKEEAMKEELGYMTVRKFLADFNKQVEVTD